jgi:hypothetical protein
MWRTTLILCVCAIALGAEAPTSAPDDMQMVGGKEALHRYEAAYLAARQTYYNAMIDADQKKIMELDKLMKIAMSAGDLDEANRIKAAHDVATDMLNEHKQALQEAPSSSSPVQADARHTFAIFARERWKATVKVQKGQRYRVSARGQWSGGPDANKNKLQCGPEGFVMPDGDHQGDYVWYLEGRVNRKYPFVIGASGEFTAQEDGLLEMQMMDWWIYDNDGSIEAQVQHIPVGGP